MEALAERRAEPRTHLRPLRLLGDEQLAGLIAGGDRRAFAVVYDRHRPAIVRYCKGILVNAEDAEDAAQNAMLAALRSLPDRPPRLQLRAWLFRVAHNEAISLMRRRHGHASLSLALDLAGADPDDAAATRARLRELVDDLRALPERQRGALVMRELCGLGYHEIAGALGGSEGAAMQTVFEARSALMQCDEGRAMSCASVQRCMSDGDRRRTRARRLRAHVRDCDQCQAFERSLSVRRRDLGLLVPVGGKAGLIALFGLLGGGEGLRVLTGGPVVPPGLRAAAISAVLVTAGGGVAAEQIVSHAISSPPAGHPSAPVAIVAHAPGSLPRSLSATGAPSPLWAHRRGRAARAAAVRRIRVGRLTVVPAIGPGRAVDGQGRHGRSGGLGPLVSSAPGPVSGPGPAPAPVPLVATPPVSLPAGSQSSSLPGARPGSTGGSTTTSTAVTPAAAPTWFNPGAIARQLGVPLPVDPVRVLQQLAAACMRTNLGPLALNMGPGCR